MNEHAAQRCVHCISQWVDWARSASGPRLTEDERRSLVAALLARRHLILSGPADTGKCELARALAMFLAEGRQDHVCTVLGHPWWAGRTGDVGHYASMQTGYTAWRLVFFLEPVLNGRTAPAEPGEEPEADRVICVERMGPAELDFYFGVLPQRLGAGRENGSGLPVTFIGTYDCDTPPALDDQVLGLAGLVHLGNQGNGRPASEAAGESTVCKEGHRKNQEEWFAHESNPDSPGTAACAVVWPADRPGGAAGRVALDPGSQAAR